MAISLQDQLLKAGLVDEKKAKQIKKQKVKKAKAQKQKGKNAVVENPQAAVLAAKAEKAARDQALNKQRQEEAEQKSLEASVKQMILQHQQPIPASAEVAYNFAYQKKIKRIYVTEAQQGSLSRGHLALAFLDDKFYVIPDKIAERIETRKADAVIRIEPENKVDDEDDPYADYAIPDDLMW